MNSVPLSWMGLSIAIPVVGAFAVSRTRNPDRARHWSVVITAATLLSTIGVWCNFQLLESSASHAGPRLVSRCLGYEALVIDQFSAPLLPLTAALYFLTTATTLRTKIRRFSFGLALVSEAIALAIFACSAGWLLITLLVVGTVPPYLELRSRAGSTGVYSTRVYVVHMALFVGLLLLGQVLVDLEGGTGAHSVWAILPLLLAVLVRSGIVPFHCWITDLFEHATFGTALLYATPLVGAYAAVRLVLPIAPEWVLRSMGLVSLATAVYAAGMALIQRDARRLFSYLFLSHSALVLVGLEMLTPIGLTGALCVWLSVGLAMGGFGLTMRALESRVGRLSLVDFQGLYDHTPNLAMCFLLTGLASVGFPGTFGFVGTELLVDGAVETYLYVGVAVVVAAAINGIAVVKAYFLLFTGTRHASSVSLMIARRERYAVLALAGLIFYGGFVPQPGVESRHQAADELLQAHAARENPSTSSAGFTGGRRSPEPPLCIQQPKTAPLGNSLAMPKIPFIALQ